MRRAVPILFGGIFSFTTWIHAEPAIGFSANPSLDSDNWRYLAQRILAKRPTATPREVIAYIEGLELRLSATQERTLTSMGRIHAVLADELQARRMPLLKTPLTALASELSARQHGAHAAEILDFLLMPAAKVQPEIAAFVGALSFANTGCNGKASYLTIYRPGTSGYPAYGVNCGQMPSMDKFNGTNLTLIQIHGTDGARVDTMGYNPGLPKTDTLKLLTDGTFTQVFTGVDPKFARVHAILLGVMESLLKNLTFSEDSPPVFAGDVKANARMASTVHHWLKTRKPTLDTAFATEFTEMRKALGDLTAGISTLAELREFFAEQPVVTGDFPGLETVMEYRQKRGDSALLTHLAGLFSVSNTDDPCFQKLEP